jgi:hypothetical protein
LLVRRYWLGLPLFLLSFTVGVGKILAAIASTNEPDDPLRRNRSAIAGVGATPMQASAVGVGQHPNPVAFVRGACVMRSQHSPPRMKPQRGKVTEDHGKSSPYKHRAVFHPNEARSYLTDNSRHLCPKP